MAGEDSETGGGALGSEGICSASLKSSWGLKLASLSPLLREKILLGGGVLGIQPFLGLALS